MKIAIMQPYFAPHMAYFQLINEVDKFVFLEDVNFIKGGWIHRNVITLNNRPHRFSIPLKGQSSFRKINEIEVDWNSRCMIKLEKTFRQKFEAASKSWRILEEIFAARPRTISALAIASVKSISRLLGVGTRFASSLDYGIQRRADRTDFLVGICRMENAATYVNSIGGRELYCRHQFLKHNIELQFLDGMRSNSLLDVIDTLPPQRIADDLESYNLI